MNDKNAGCTVTMCNGDLRAWIEQEAIHVKAVDSHGDPVELTAHEARELAKHLITLADKVKE